MDDPFVSTPPHAQPPQPLRHAAFDPDAFSLQANSSPKQALLALQAHLKETDRRIQETSKLGTSLVRLRKDLDARQKDLSAQKDANEIGPDLRKKLTELEREYTDVGRETARAVLPKSRLASNEYLDPTASPAVFAGVSGASPSKVAVPSRKQRNQTANRVHDIEFATEISTSLLAQVRSLQAALVEKDDALKQETADKAQLEHEHGALRSRLRHLDENEQRFKDENWNLETQMQDLTAAMKVATEKELRANQNSKSAQTARETILRELEDLKQTHGKLSDEVAASKRSQESEMHLLRRDIAGHESERDLMQRKIEELTSQNTELARAISYRMNGEGNGLDRNLGSGDDELTTDREFSEASPPPSPTKRGAGQGMLETETLRSSIQHAHRMIQTLKNNIHREKTEKLELKRLLQDARDELESRRGDGKANTLKNRRSVVDAAKARKARADQLGTNRISREEIINDDDWEDHEGDTLRPAADSHRRKVSMPGAFMSQSEDSTDAFETANEKETSTETEAFQTGNEAMSGDDSGEATETEGQTAGTSKQRMSSMPTSMQQKRASFMSTASTSADEDDDLFTPVAAQPRYKVKNVRTRGSLRDTTPSATNSPINSVSFRDSPAFSMSSSKSTPIPAGQTLGDELDGLSDEVSMEGTPSRRLSLASSSMSQDWKRRSVIRSPVPSKPAVEMVDSGMMTEPWQPAQTAQAGTAVDSEEPEEKSKGLLAATAGALGGLVTGGLLGRHAEKEHEQARVEQNEDALTALQTKSVPFTHQLSNIFSSHTEPVEAEPEKPKAHDFSAISSNHTEPMQAARPTLVAHQYSGITSNHTEPVEAEVAKQKPHDFSIISSNHTEPREAETIQREPHDFSTISSHHTEPIEQTRPTPVGHQYSDIFSNHTEPVEVPRATPVAHQYAGITSQHTEPEHVPEPEVVPEHQDPFDFELSPIKSEQFEPWSPSENSTIFPVRSSSRRGNVAAAGAGAVAGGLLGANLGQKSLDDDDVFGGAQQENRSRPPFAELDGNAVAARHPRSSAHEKILAPHTSVSDEGTQTMVSSEEIDRMMRDKSKSHVPAAALGATAAAGAAATMIPGSPVSQQNSPRRASEPGHRAELPGTVVRRPGSSGSMRKNHMPPPSQPPLPTNHTERIAQANGKAPLHPPNGAMGPPLMPASAYRSAQRDASVRSRTSTINTAQKAVSVRGGPVNGSMRSPISRQSSISSFASEIDHRLNPNGAFAYPADIPPATDPRMITAITQTMIGEYLWKYTRSPLSSSSISSNRHRRFFWVHPYTRTLYWSESDPSTAGKSQLKAKSVAIEAVRVVSDDNAYPPGLCAKSLVVVTPAREIVFTAPTSQRHETWFNALSYLLLRTAPTSDANTSTAIGTITGTTAGLGVATGGAEDIDDDDVAEFNPSYHNSSATRGGSTARPPMRASHVSVNSYASNATTRSRPHAMDVPTLTPTTSYQGATAQTANYGTYGTATSRQAGKEEPLTPLRSPRSPSVTGRISSFFSGGSARRRESVGRLSRRGSRAAAEGGREEVPPVPAVPSRTVSTNQGQTQMQSATVGQRSASALSNRSGKGVVRSESAEELRRRIEEEERRERMENVRACCDGKHDVGSLAKRGDSFRGRAQGGGFGGSTTSRY